MFVIFNETPINKIRIILDKQYFILAYLLRWSANEDLADKEWREYDQPGLIGLFSSKDITELGIQGSIPPNIQTSVPKLKTLQLSYLPQSTDLSWYTLLRHEFY